MPYASPTIRNLMQPASRFLRTQDFPLAGSSIGVGEFVCYAPEVALQQFRVTVGLSYETPLGYGISGNQFSLRPLRSLRLNSPCLSINSSSWACCCSSR